MSTLMVFVIFFLLNFVFGFVGELDSLRGDYDSYAAFLYILFKSPYFMVKIFPISLLIGAVFSLGKLSDQSELTVLRSSGISNFKLLSIIIVTGSFLVIMAMAMTELMVPKSERYAQGIVNTSLNRTHFQETKYGVWILQDGNFIYIKKMNSASNMQELSVFDYDGLTLKQIKRIKKAHLSEQGNWLFKGITNFKITASKVEKSKQDKEVMTSTLAPDVLAQIQVEPDKLSANELLEQHKFLISNGLNVERIEQALWKRMAYPLSTLLMLFLAFPFVLKSSRSTSLSQKVLFGVLFGVFFFVMNLIVEQFGLIFNIPAWVPIFSPTLLFLILGIWAYKRI